MDLSTYTPGDYLRLQLAKEEIDGTLLQNPDPSIILIKLPSGYNIGIPKENILAARALRKYKPATSKDMAIPSNSKLPSIGLIVTGGTIASKLDPRTGGVHPLTDVHEFARYYPALFKKVNVKKIEIPFMIASESMAKENWVMMAESVKQLLDDPDIQGVIITHGTDTIHYTAAALSFFLQDLTKPVVLTYAQRSIDRASSDANLNLQCAAQMALSDVAEVMLVGHASTNDDYCVALRGTKVRKMHSSQRDAFKPINTKPLAKVWPDKVEMLLPHHARHKGSTKLDTECTDKIALVKFYPGQTPDILDFYALKYKGIVIEATGFGHVPVSEAKHNWIPTLKKHIKQGFVVCIAAQTVYGNVNPYVYTNLRELADTGAIFLQDMLAETAFVKLGWVLGHYGWKKDVKEKMLHNFAGELNPRLTLE